MFENNNIDNNNIDNNNIDNNVDNYFAEDMHPLSDESQPEYDLLKEMPLKDNKPKIDDSNSDMQIAYTSLQQKINENNNLMLKIHTKMDLLKDKTIGITSKMIDLLKDKKTLITSEINHMMADIKDVTSEIYYVKNDIKNITSEIDCMKDDIKNVTSEMNCMKDDVNYMMKEYKPRSWLKTTALNITASLVVQGLFICIAKGIKQEN
ncbi:hypothetical protein GUI12_04210 [Anaplasmataceae bacterium AB001_6]|nr:hypothetical protein GUI12_04210 [Anaplasmataceae bacterium AB001_6]